MRFLPREEKFFALFLKQVEIISQAGRLLVAGVRDGNSRLTAVAADIGVLERKGDEIIHEVFTRLNQTFITPLDPEDIHALSSSLDDVLDGIEDAAHHIAAYRLEPITPVIIQLSEIVDASCQTLEQAFQALHRNQRVLEYCIEINRLEDEADRIGRLAVEGLFRDERDPIALIKYKEVYELLEATTDRCEDVADVLQNVVVKNS
jgi:predicted phosphate transport protein (TIGR00153 family)